MRRLFAGYLIPGIIVILGFASTLWGAEVGRVTQVEGGVDILRGGQLPAIPAKVDDIINANDIIRTKSLSSAEIKFVDESSITIAPGSRIAIEEYMYNEKKGERNATLNVFMGLVHTVVKRIHNVKEPDFTVKTHTAVIGVRGTDWFTQILPAATDVYNGSGKTEVRNSFAEVPGKVTLTGLEFSRVTTNMPPTLPMPIGTQDITLLRNHLHPQHNLRNRGTQTSSGPTATTSGTSLGSMLTSGRNTTTTMVPINQTILSQATVQSGNPETVPALTVPPTPTSAPTPTPAPAPSPSPSPTPTPVPFSVSFFSNMTYTVGPLNNTITTAAGTVQFNISQGPYTGTAFGRLGLLLNGSLPAAVSPPTISGSLSGNVTGVAGGTYSGTVSGAATITASAPTAGPVTMNLSGPVTNVGPAKTFTFQATSGTTITGSGYTGTVISGTVRSP